MQSVGASGKTELAVEPFGCVLGLIQSYFSRRIRREETNDEAAFAAFLKPTLAKAI